MKKLSIMKDKNEQKQEETRQKPSVVIAPKIKRTREFINKYGEVIRTEVY